MSYALNVYMRAATCLRTLENFIGKEAMLRVMRAFHTRFRFRHPTTRDFIATASEVSGRDLNWFFDELFFGTREWDYAVDPVTSPRDQPPPAASSTARERRARSRPGRPATWTRRTRTRRYQSLGPGHGAWAKRGPAPASGSRC